MLKQNYSVLLVDDESTARKLIGERISRIPGVTLVASLSHGLSARDYLMDHIVDIVIADIMMPHMDGLELTALIKQMDKSCPVVIISGFKEFEYARKAIQYGVKEYLLKPVRFRQIVETLESCCDEVKKRREQWLTFRDNSHSKLEKSLYRGFVNGDTEADWLVLLEGMMPVGGRVIQLEPTESLEVRIEEQAAIYKNILNDALGDCSVLCMGYHNNKYEYLVIPSQQQPSRQMEAVSEFLNRVLEVPVILTEICTVNSARELLEKPVFFDVKKKNGSIEAACRYIEEHYAEMLTRDMVAKKACLSPSHFTHLFKREMGMGYGEYLTAVRIEKAKELLQSDLSVKEVAEAVGFSDAHYFRDVFYKRTGYVPSKYRQGER